MPLFVIGILSCDPATLVTQKHYFSNEYVITKVIAPNYPIKGEKRQNTVSIDFPKQGFFTLYLSESQCSGEYEANIDGTLSFTRTNCTSECCESEWDFYILTLIKKTKRFEGGKNKPLTLFINDNNYLTLENKEPNK